jgi:hypothetical protein
LVNKMNQKSNEALQVKLLESFLTDSGLLVSASHLQRKIPQPGTSTNARAPTRKARPSLLERTIKLCGVGASGMGDLSCNPRHLDDFGR